MEVDLDFKWETQKNTKKEKCEYLSPLTKRRLENSKEDPLDCTEIVKYMHTQKNINPETTLVKRFNFSRAYSVLLCIPRAFMHYLYFIFDAIFMMVIIYAILQLFIFLQKDLMHKIREKTTELNQIVEMAKFNYKINKCKRSTRVPALENVCNKWECTIKNGSIGYTKVFFEVFGDVLDGFIRKFSVRSTIVLSIFLLIYLKYRTKK
ncbi:Nucleus export protein BRL1 [Nosema granulosis]|uniref:Nucleus export protein BRL1 n=1 Tax=Nosema granulosis TaxID=83296 RepID=A0A9P6KZL2_9MICR|nr:Nucleus export protein BRL1 [Nosema granulosis]